MDHFRIPVGCSGVPGCLSDQNLKCITRCHDQGFRLGLGFQGGGFRGLGRVEDLGSTIECVVWTST